MTLMTVDVDRVADFSFHSFSLVSSFSSSFPFSCCYSSLDLTFFCPNSSFRPHQVDAPLEIVVGSLFLYNILGVSSIFGLVATCIFLPLNHFASKIVVKAQDNLMKARDERTALMNETLQGIRMLKVRVSFLV
jgi:ABC-type multidrug transport system fused ATPase/permease subunit